ncbi:MAG: MaoC family dehydratase [Rhodobacteraceae bacterium]|nr:MAG: MaoC family dehydratase [Paracoccaceae bacterium]
MDKTNPGNFFEDFRLGRTFVHAAPRTVGDGERALYTALYPTRFAITSSDAFARACGLPAAPLDPLIGFHVAFGKTVPDVSLNAVANLGYAECRFLRPLHPGAEIRTTTEVIGLRQNANGRTGVVWVRSTATDAAGAPLATWARWVMVRKNDLTAPAPETTIPDLAPSVAAEALAIPEGLDFSGYDFALGGEPWRWGDYAVGERIDHVDGVTVQEAEHMMATRLWQNTSKVHFNVAAREDGRPLVYGGHVISLARALSFNGLANACLMVAINGGTHAAPCFAGDTVYAWSEVLDRAETAVPSVGALRLRLVATTDPLGARQPLKGDDGKYAPGVLLDLDYWALIPR